MMQLLRFTKVFGDKANIWINPDQIIFAEVGEKKEEGKKEMVKYTVLHVTGKEGKVFVKEHPDEINKIVRSIKRDIKIEI